MKDEQYNVYFSKETVAQAAALFMKQKRVDSYTAEHEKPVQGLSIFESWIIQDKDQDKSNLYGFDLPQGTWMVSVYVGNDEVWQGVKEGEYKGFSIEGYFVDRLVKMQQEVSKEDIAEAVREALVPAKVLDGDPLFETARAPTSTPRPSGARDTTSTASMAPNTTCLRDACRNQRAQEINKTESPYIYR